MGTAIMPKMMPGLGGALRPIFLAYVSLALRVDLFGYFLLLPLQFSGAPPSEMLAPPCVRALGA